MAWEKFEFAETNTTLPAMIVIVDELAELIDTSSMPRSEARKADQIAGNINSIARLGRASHIHLILATQSSSGNLFPPSLKNNIQFRNICGRVDGNISRMAIDTEEGESIPTSVGSYMGWCKGDTLGYQGWYTPTKQVLSLGTIKEGYDPETGLEAGESGAIDFSNLPTYVEPANDPAQAEVPASTENMSMDGISENAPGQAAVQTSDNENLLFNEAAPANDVDISVPAQPDASMVASQPTNNDSFGMVPQPTPTVPDNQQDNNDGLFVQSLDDMGNNTSASPVAESPQNNVTDTPLFNINTVQQSAPAVAPSTEPVDTTANNMPEPAAESANDDSQQPSGPLKLNIIT